ncbi:ABC transporter permease [Blautia sp. OF03-15BH]|uniref:ABC transporter permease n=1 Tax=Blautia sp. OF03-15BH TaxID=2292287 RepID=UPI000E548E15|nr:ABC transporter permease [Blautia sp. OF03-15BH]RGY02313.1 ABC transporter permease [Blautia sp. OF03-15BH]
MSVLLAMFSAIAQGMLWAMLALGVYITFRLLDFADLTCEGSFAMGACISAVMTVTYHMNPFISLIFGFLGGAIAGTVTGLLNTKLKIPPILAGILSMISLYSINLRIMSDKANLPINVREEGVESMVTLVQKLLPESIRTMSQTTTVIAACIGVIFCVLSVAVLYWFFGTELGSAIRATGNNEKMIRALGVNTDHMKLVALALSNGFIALSGSLVAQNQKVADVGSGTGAIVIGLASIVIGEVLFAKATSFKWRLTGIIVGSIVYRMIVAIVLQLGMRSSDLKLLTAILVAVALSVPRLLQVKNGKGARS